MKNDGTLSFAANQGNSIDNIFKKLVASNLISEETTRSLKLVGTTPGIIYGLGKFHKDINDNYPPFQHFVSN